MNTTEFETMLFEFAELDYYEFSIKICLVDLNDLNDEQEEKLRKLFESKIRINEEDKNTRLKCMEEIEKMTAYEFIDKLMHGGLPEFKIASKFDTDYKLFRDDNNENGYNRAYCHRMELSQMTRETFMCNNILSYQEQMIYYERKDAMNKIINMSEEDFKNALENDNLPKFIRSKPGDLDFIQIYRSISAIHGYASAFWNRIQLLTIEADDLKSRFIF